MYSILREHAFTVPQFLLIDTYDSKPGGKDDILAHRYLDHFLSQRVSRGTRDTTYILPSPYNMGRRWYCDAFEAIKRDAWMVNERQGWNWGSWMEFWGDFDVFHQLDYKEKLRTLQYFEEADARRSSEMRSKGILWLKVSIVICAAWLRTMMRWIVWGIGRAPERMPWLRPRLERGARSSILVGKTEYMA